MFGGVDAAGGNGLFVYNGQSVSEISINGAYFGGINLSDLTVFNNEVLFNGFDAAGKQGLWVTDGTTAGTHEIAVNGAAPGGLNPSDLTVFNHHEVLFDGVDAAGKQGLWVTDGTTTGTHEITGISGASSNGLAPADLTVLPDGNKPMGAVTAGSDGTAQLVQAMAGFGGGSGAGESLNTVSLGADTTQQPLLITPQHA